MGSNNLTNYGKDMSGLLKLVEILPQTKIESLRCAASPPQRLRLCQGPLTRKRTLSLPMSALPCPSSFHLWHYPSFHLRQYPSFHLWQYPSFLGPSIFGNNP